MFFWHFWQTLHSIACPWMFFHPIEPILWRETPLDSYSSNDVDWFFVPINLTSTMQCWCADNPYTSARGWQKLIHEACQLHCKHDFLSIKSELFRIHMTIKSESEESHNSMRVCRRNNCFMKSVLTIMMLNRDKKANFWRLLQDTVSQSCAPAIK